MKNEGYVIETIVYQMDGTFYRRGYYGDGFFNTLCPDVIYSEPEKDEAIETLLQLREEYNDGTVIFKLHKIKMEINLTEVVL